MAQYGDHHILLIQKPRTVCQKYFYFFKCFAACCAFAYFFGFVFNKTHPQRDSHQQQSLLTTESPVTAFAHAQFEQGNMIGTVLFYVLRPLSWYLTSLFTGKRGTVDLAKSRLDVRENLCCIKTLFTPDSYSELAAC